MDREQDTTDAIQQTRTQSRVAVVRVLQRERDRRCCDRAGRGRAVVGYVRQAVAVWRRRARSACVYLTLGWAPWFRKRCPMGLGTLRVGKLPVTWTSHLLGSLPVFHLSENS